MKSKCSLYLAIALMLAISLSLAGCASNRHSYLRSDLTEEHWMQAVDTNPDPWVGDADNWFLTGNPNSVEMLNRRAPSSDVITTMTVSAADFTDIEVNGDFEVQIFGTDGPNSIYVNGPNDAVRDVVIKVKGHTLCVYQAKKSPSPALRRVIVRIGVNTLNSLTQMGCGLIEAIRLQSNGLIIRATPTAMGNMYLAGNMNVSQITNSGKGSINVFGANTSGLIITTKQRGCVNVSGKCVNIRSISHQGNNNINIIGANSNGLVIHASGNGKIGINGQVNIREIRASDAVRVYAYPVMSNSLNVFTQNNAQVGLAGYTHDLFVDTSRSSRFEGRYLCAENAYVSAHDSSHINVAASNKIFASAMQNSSVYFFGSPNLLSQFTKGDGVVIPVWYEGARSCAYFRPGPQLYYKVTKTIKVKSRVHVNHYKQPANPWWKHKRSVKFSRPQGEG